MRQAKPEVKSRQELLELFMISMSLMRCYLCDKLRASVHRNDKEKR